MSFSTVSLLRGKQPVARGTVSRIRGNAAPKVKGAVSRIRGTIASALVINAGSVQVVEPFETVLLDPSITEGLAPDVWVWTQTGGPAVTLVQGANGQAAFKAFGPLATTVLTFQIRATTAGFPDATDTTTVTVRAHTHFRYNGAGVLVGIEGIDTAGFGSDVPPSTTTGLGLAPLGTSPLGA